MSEILDLCSTFLKLFARGGIKVRSALLVVVIFTSCIVGLFSIFSSYSSELSLVFETWASNENLYVSGEFFKGSINVTVYYVDFEGAEGLLVLVDDIEGYIDLHGCRVEGRLPSVENEVVAGFRLGFQVGDNLTIINTNLTIVGIIFCDDYVSYSVVGSSSLNISLENGFKFYEGRITKEKDQNGVFAPSITSLFSSVLLEVWRSFSIILAVLTICLVIGVFYAGYALVLESKDVFEKLRHLSPSLRKLIIALFFASLIVCLCGVLMGVALGFLGSSIFSVTISLVFGFPYVRPVFPQSLLPFSMAILVASWASFSISLVFCFVRNIREKGS